MASHPKGWTKAKAARAHRAPRKRRPAPPKDLELGDYTVRVGTDGQMGIYLRRYNLRLAIFNDNSDHLQAGLQRVFDLVASGQLSC